MRDLSCTSNRLKQTCKKHRTHTTILTPQQREVLHLFDDSICPDPDVFIFITFSIFTLLWMAYHLISSSQPRSISPRRGTTATAILSVIYTFILTVLLLDGCWMAVIYGWTLSIFAKGEGRTVNGIWGVVDWLFRWLVLCITCIVMLPSFFLWVVTVVRTTKRLILLWRSMPTGLPTTSTTSGKDSTLVNSN